MCAHKERERERERERVTHARSLSVQHSNSGKVCFFKSYDCEQI